MKNITWLLLSILLAATLTLGSCGGSNKKIDDQAVKVENPATNQFETLITYIENSGDLINNRIVPTMIEPSEVYENMTAYNIIDIRMEADFDRGHIDGAKNVKMAELINHFENIIDPPSFSKIVIVCQTGQSASFATALLRMLGYNNVYAMKWGMSSWDESFAEAKWLKNISNKYADKLETSANPKASVSPYPVVMTTKTDGYSIVRERAVKLLNDGFMKYTVKSDDVFTDNTPYYIINYWPEALYDKGHIPGAIQYQPKKSLARATYLSTLPTDKIVVPYCFTGQHSAFVTAYLNVIGYEAKSLLYGANGFMNTVMKERDAKLYHAFSKKKILGYEFVKEDATIEQPEVVAAGAGGC